MASFPQSPTLAVIVRGRYWSVVFRTFVAGSLANISGSWSGELTDEPGDSALATITMDETAESSGTITGSLDANTTAALDLGKVWVGVNVSLSGNSTQIIRSQVRVVDPA